MGVVGYVSPYYLRRGNALWNKGRAELGGIPTGVAKYPTDEVSAKIRGFEESRLRGIFDIT